MWINTKVGLRLVGVEDEHKGSGARIYDRNVVKLKGTYTCRMNILKTFKEVTGIIILN